MHVKALYRPSSNIVTFFEVRLSRSVLALGSSRPALLEVSTRIPH